MIITLTILIKKYAYEPKEEDSAFVPLDNIDLSNILCIRDKKDYAQW